LAIITKYLKFKRIGRNPKTEIWGVYTKKPEVRLGKISWHGAFRKYCYFPDKIGGVPYDYGCLNDISEFLVVATAEHRKNKK